MFTFASQITPQAIDWLWPNRIALRKIALLEGDPELGKTWVTCDLGARLSVGQLFPDGQPSSGPATSILLNAEDGAADTLRPRLEALGADLSRVLIPTMCEGERLLSFPTDLARLESLIANHQARLVVIDPWIAFLDATVQISSDAGVRKVLRGLLRVAERRACAILLVRHLRKQGSGHAIYRGSGSIGLIAMCRSAWLIARSPMDDACIFAQVKNNLAPRQPSLAFEISRQLADVSGQLAGDTGKISLPSADCQLPSAAADCRQPTVPFRWLGPTFWSADELSGGRLTRAGRRAQARAFLLHLLQAGALPVGKIRAEAREQGIADRTLDRAYKDLKVQSRRVVFPGSHGRNYWLLAGQALPKIIPEEYVLPVFDRAVP